MGRLHRGGVTGGSGVGDISVTATTFTAPLNQDITMDAVGTGIFKIASDAQLQAQGDLRFADSDNSNYVAFQAPATVTSNLTWTLPATDGTANQVLRTNGSTVLTFGPAVPWTNFTVTGNFNAVNVGQYFVDTNGGAVTATLPANPTLGDEIRFFDLRKTFDTFALTVGRNTRLIMGDAADLTVTTEGAGFSLVYSGDTYGWRILTV
jgi:hypothetical protein